MTQEEMNDKNKEVIERFEDRFPNKIAEVIDDFGSDTKQQVRNFIEEQLALKDKEKEEALSKQREEIADRINDESLGIFDGVNRCWLFKEQVLSIIRKQ